jgi:hypothetical protein
MGGVSTRIRDLLTNRGRGGYTGLTSDTVSTTRVHRGLTCSARVAAVGLFIPLVPSRAAGLSETGWPMPFRSRATGT